MLTLYYSPNACSLSVHIVLHWCNAIFETERVVFGQPPLTKLSSLGTVGLIDRGDESGILTQTPAILLYLAERFPLAGIGGEDSLNGRAEKNQWLSFLVSDVHHVFHLLLRSSRYGIENNKSARDSARKLCIERLTILENHLKSNQWMLGDQRSIVDAYLFPMIRWYYRVFPEKEHHFKSLNRFYDAMYVDIGVQYAMQEEGIL